MLFASLLVIRLSHRPCAKGDTRLLMIGLVFGEVLRGHPALSCGSEPSSEEDSGIVLTPGLCLL